MRKALIVVGTLAVLLLLSIAVIPFVFRDRLVAAATTEIGRHVDATVAITSADVSLLGSFPDLELTLGGLSVVGRGPFDGVPLARVGEARVAVDLASVVGGDTLRIRSLRVEDAEIHVIVDEQGRMNTDLTGTPAEAPAEGAAPSTFALDLEDYALVDLDVTYEDRAGGTDVRLEDLDSSGHVELASGRTTVATKTTIAALSVDELLRRVAVSADLAVDIDEKGAITLGETHLSLNELALAFRGTVVPAGEDLGLDLSFSASETSFGALFSLVPAAYTKDVQGLVTNGSLALQGAVKGTMKGGAEDHLPGFDLTLQVADGAFRYPSLPTSVDGIQLEIAVRHPEGGTDLTEVEVKRFAMAVGGSPVTGSLSVRHPISDPDVAAVVKGQLDLGVLRQALPPSPASYQGKADLDLEVAGRVSQFTAQAVDQVKARGTLRLDDFRYESPESSVPIVIDRLLLTLDPRRADLAELTMRLGETDLRAKGTVDNAIAYALTDATLVGRMDVSSSFLDLDAFAGGDDEGGDDEAATATPAGTPPGAEESSLVMVPKNLDFALTAKADRIRYGGHDARNATGTFTVKDGAVRIDALRMDMLGGTVGISGSYATPSEAQADVDLELEVVDFDVGETVAAFETLQEVVPVAKGARGRFRSGLRMQARLGKDLSPDLSSVLSNGRLQTSALTLEPSFLSEVADRLGNKTFRTLDLDDATLAFEVKEGRVRMKPAAVKVGGAAATLGGSAGALDRTLDLDLGVKVPVGQVKAADLLGKIGVAKGGLADVKVKIGGTYDKPTVRLDLGDVAAALEEKVAQVVDDATDRVLAEAKAAGDALVAEAEKQAAKLRAEAKKQADALKAEARKQGDKLAAEAKGNPIAEAAAKEAKKKLLAEADKKVDKLEAEADKQAKAGVEAAKREQAKLLREAAAKAKGTAAR